jgi:ribosomal protein S12 methylthiotransferase accessory factor YcaO
LDAAKVKLAGESVERFALASGPPGEAEEFASWKELKAGGFEALDPAALVCGDGTPVQARREDSVRWVRGATLRSEDSLFDGCSRGNEAMIPEQLIGVPHRFSEGEAVWRAPVSTGAAAHRSREAATRSAVAEVVERDAFQAAWLVQVPLPDVSFDSWLSDRAAWLAEQCRRHRLTVDVRRLPPVVSRYRTVLAVVRDRSGVGPPSTVAAKPGSTDRVRLMAGVGP